METLLKATKQKSYYYKAVIITEEEQNKLKSYNTVVCSYNTKTKEFCKLWNGYSKTTLNHVNDFRKLFSLPELNKKQWEHLTPTDTTTKYYVTGTNGFVNFTTQNYFDNYDDANDFAETLQEKNRFWFYDVIEG